MRASRGFIALFSMLGIAAASLAFFSLAGASVRVLQDAGAAEYAYQQAVQASWSCAALAFSRLSADPSRFSSNAPVSVQVSDTAWCMILGASTTGTAANADSRGFSGSRVVNIRFSAIRASSTDPFRMTSWEKY